MQQKYVLLAVIFSGSGPKDKMEGTRLCGIGFVFDTAFELNGDGESIVVASMRGCESETGMEILGTLDDA